MVCIKLAYCIHGIQGWGFSTAAKLQNVFDMSKNRVKYELSMNLVKRITFLTIRVNIVYTFYILLYQKWMIK